MRARTFLLWSLLVCASTAQVETEASRRSQMQQHERLLLRGLRVFTLEDGPDGRPLSTPIEADILIEQGRILAIGSALEVREDTPVFDLEGCYALPGIIDAHSHMAIAGGVNEGTHSITPEVRIADALRADDVHLYRALAGGVTTILQLHGSANVIGGQASLLKLRYGQQGSELVFAGAPRAIKFALGENVTHANRSERGGRFPASRPGVEALLRRAFDQALAYQAAWQAHLDGLMRGRAGQAPRRDLRLETLLGVLSGEIRVHCHCYRADEIEMLLRVAEDYGFRVAVLQHVLEGYKVADKLAAHGAAASTFSDWWSYKQEAYDAVPHNAALMARAGVLVSLNSDSAEETRHLNLEAGKMLRYGPLSVGEALAMVTRNPAKQLGVDEQVGRLRPGMDADIAVFWNHPLSSRSRCVLTLVDGVVRFDDRDGPRAPQLAFAPQAREPLQLDPEAMAWAFVGADLHPVSSEPLPAATLLVTQGRIEALGYDLALPDGTQQLDVAGCRIQPGLISGGSYLAVREIGSVAGTVDHNETGSFQPDLEIAGALFAPSRHIAATRVAGITSALVEPGSKRFAGQSALIRLRGARREDLVLNARFAEHLQLPRFPDDVRDERGLREGQKQLEALKQRFLQVRRQQSRGAVLDRREQVLLECLDGRLPVVMHADGARQILAGLELAAELGFHPIISGGASAWKVADSLAVAGADVLLGPIESLPSDRWTPYDMPFRNASVLAAAGVRFGFRTGSNWDGNARNLPYHAALCVAYGLPEEAALRALTLDAAEILGLVDKGRLEVGLPADFVVSSDNLLEVSARVLAVFVDGVPISLHGPQEELAREAALRLFGEDER